MDGGDGLNGVCASNGRCVGFGEAEVLYFALLDELLNGSGYVFNRDGGIRTVLVEEVDCVDPKSPERFFGDLLDSFGAAVDFAGLDIALCIRVVAELGRDDDFALEGFEGFANECFVGERAIDFGGIEEGHAEIDCFVQEFDHFGVVADWGIAETHSHAAESESGDFEPAFA